MAICRWESLRLCGCLSYPGVFEGLFNILNAVSLFLFNDKHIDFSIPLNSEN